MGESKNEGVFLIYISMRSVQKLPPNGLWRGCMSGPNTSEPLCNVVCLHDEAEG